MKAVILSAITLIGFGSFMYWTLTDYQQKRVLYKCYDWNTGAELHEFDLNSPSTYFNDGNKSINFLDIETGHFVHIDYMKEHCVKSK